MFISAYNQFLGSKEQYIEEYSAVADVLADTSEIDEKIAALQAERAIAAELVRNCVEENSRLPQDQEQYKKQYEALFARYNKAEKGQQKLIDSRLSLVAKCEAVRRFIDSLLQSEDKLIVAFDGQLLCTMVEKAVVHSKEDVRFVFRNGAEIKA